MENVKCPKCGSDRLLIHGDEAQCLDCKAKLQRRKPDLMRDLQQSTFGKSLLNSPGVTAIKGDRTYVGGKLQGGSGMDRIKDWWRRMRNKPIESKAQKLSNFLLEDKD